MELWSKVSSNPPIYHAGERVSVLYDPVDAHWASIDRFLSLWFMTLLLGGLGKVLLVAGVIALRTRAARAFTESSEALTGAPSTTT